MSKETKETTEMAEVETTDLTEYEFSNFVDDALASGALIDKYVYEAKIGGRKVQGLTAESFSQMALERGICEVSYTREVVEVDGVSGVLYEVTAGVHQENVPKEQWETRTGVFFQPFKYAGKPDPFVYPKAHTKAWRNAVRKFIRATDIHGAISTFLDLGNNSKATPQELPKQTTDSPVTVARKAMFAKYNERKHDLENLGITEEIFKNGLYANYGVASRSDMTEGQYRNAAAALDLPNFAKWIQNLVPVVADEDVASGEEESAEEQIHF